MKRGSSWHHQVRSREEGLPFSPSLSAKTRRVGEGGLWSGLQDRFVDSLIKATTPASLASMTVPCKLSESVKSTISMAFSPEGYEEDFFLFSFFFFFLRAKILFFFYPFWAPKFLFFEYFFSFLGKNP